MENWNDIILTINNHTQEAFELDSVSSVGGGCINQAWHLKGNVETELLSDNSARDYFVKSNSRSGLNMFEAEYDALLEIQKSKTIRVPTPIVTGSGKDSSWLVLEYISLSGSGGEQQLGRQLAAMHDCVNERFGWVVDNTIGSTEQINTQCESWVDFWRDYRLGFQLETAAKNGYGGRLQTLGDQLMSGLEVFFEGHTPIASLLHGDLWGGNWSCASTGEPVIYDPATYYGDRETDIAMTELFGGFSGAFYRAYEECSPLDEGYQTRKVLYNLYHILNHLNLFGGGYGSQAESMMKQLLSDF